MGDILQSREGGVLTLVNSDPATRNALTPDFYDRFRDIVEEAGDDSAVRAIVVTGAQGFFCSGGNVAGLRQRLEQDTAQRRAGADRLHAMIHAMRACPKPILAAVEGGAAGAGVSLALASDLIVAAKGAYLSVAYVRIGLTPDGGSTAFLSDMLPRQLVAEMLWTGDRISVERLHALGVVNRLAEPGTALAEAQAMAARLASGAAEAIGRGKTLLRAAETNDLAAQLDAEADGIATSLGGAEAREGITAFLEKRKPDFPGR